MAVYERKYQPFVGRLTERWSRFLILPRYAYRDVFASRVFLSFYVLCFVVPLSAAVAIYLPHNLKFLKTFGITNPLTSEAVAAHRAAVDRVHIDERIRQYITDLVRATRRSPSFALGASPRAGVALFLASRGEAHLSGRDFVTPDDVKRLAFPVLRHRVLLTADAEGEGGTSDDELTRLLGSLEAPR